MRKVLRLKQTYCILINMDLIVNKLSPNAWLPKKMVNSAGFCIYSRKSYIIPPNSSQIVETGIAVGIPEGFYGEIKSSKKNIMVFEGVIDSDYTGEIKVLVLNYRNNDPIVVNEADIIAEILITEIHPGQSLKEHGEMGALAEPPTKLQKRGQNGFGSTGK